MFFLPKKKRVYMDHAATTPLDSRVFSAMNDVYKNDYFNPGGLYREGVQVAQKISECRKSVASLLGTTSEHVIFTRGGTESCNLGIMGILSHLTTPPPLVPRGTSSFQEEESAPLPHVVTSDIEHPAVFETLKNLEKNNQIELSIIPVDEQGIVIVDEIKKALRPETVLVSVMYVNNEMGTVQPIKEIVKLVRWFKKHNDLKNYPLVHTDAIQATNYLDINVEKLGVDLMSLSGSKIYGPKSSGVLYVRHPELLSSMIHGGDQEFGLRAGTEDIAQIVGFTRALEITREISVSENARLTDLQNYFFAELEKNIQGIVVNGSRDYRICNNINISIPNISGERLVIELDACGIAAAAKAACRSDADEESPNVRFTMGRGTTKSDIQKTITEFATIISKIRKFSL